jgi:hypothetical protein
MVDFLLQIAPVTETVVEILKTIHEDDLSS